MLSKEEKARYSKQVILPEIGITGQEKLKSAKVLVIGAGGLGCPILQYLCAAGVGTLGIADGDKVDISNLQRQVLYTPADIGLPKAEVAKTKLIALNNNTSVICHPFFLDYDNALETIAGYDIVVDGSDNFDTRYLVNDACIMLDKPMVSGAIYKYEGQVSVFNYKGGPTYRCIFPEAPGAGESPNCADIGVIATLPGIIGTIQANEVIKMITAIGDVLAGKLLVIDTLTMHSHSFSFKLVPANKNIKTLPPPASYCSPAIKKISYENLLKIMEANPACQLVDVREMEEHIIGNIGGMNIPLSGLEDGISVLKKDTPTIVYCASGVRSMHAAKMLLNNGFSAIMNLDMGINGLLP